MVYSLKEKILIEAKGESDHSRQKAMEADDENYKIKPGAAKERFDALKEPGKKISKDEWDFARETDEAFADRKKRREIYDNCGIDNEFDDGDSDLTNDRKPSSKKAKRKAERKKKIAKERKKRGLDRYDTNNGKGYEVHAWSVSTKSLRESILEYSNLTEADVDFRGSGDDGSGDEIKANDVGSGLRPQHKEAVKHIRSILRQHPDTWAKFKSRASNFENANFITDNYCGNNEVWVVSDDDSIVYIYNLLTKKLRASTPEERKRRQQKVYDKKAANLKSSGKNDFQIQQALGKRPASVDTDKKRKKKKKKVLFY